jgi:DNA helicase II / ATP-dependent DNA helicase PcrA
MAERPSHRRPGASADQATLFDAATVAGATVAAGPISLSVTGLVSYRRCPRQYYWMAVQPLPRRASAAARIGTEVHRWIEQRSGGQLGLLDPEPAAEQLDPIDPGDIDDGAPTSLLAALRAAFLGSPYAELDPERVEVPFVLAVGGRAVRGRIDAVYRRGARLDLVDFKTGSPPEDGDQAASAQLDLYAVAATDVWGEDASALRTTYCYLHGDGSHQLVQTDWDADRLAVVRADLSASLAGLAAGDYKATPGRWCGRCEWRDVCRPGRAFLDSTGPSAGTTG